MPRPCSDREWERYRDSGFSLHSCDGERAGRSRLLRVLVALVLMALCSVPPGQAIVLEMSARDPGHSTITFAFEHQDKSWGSVYRSGVRSDQLSAGPVRVYALPFFVAQPSVSVKHLSLTSPVMFGCERVPTFSPVTQMPGYRTLSVLCGPFNTIYRRPLQEFSGYAAEMRDYSYLAIPNFEPSGVNTTRPCLPEVWRPYEVPPWNASVTWFNFGMIALLDNRLVEAKAWLEKATDSQRPYRPAEATYLLSLIASRLGNTTEARTRWLQQLPINHDDNRSMRDAAAFPSWKRTGSMIRCLDDVTREEAYSLTSSGDRMVAPVIFFNLHTSGIVSDIAVI